MSYKNLEIWSIAREVVSVIHRMTLHDLPSFEMFETGSQIRRSVKSVKSNIVEGYGRRKYVGDHIRFLTFALASNDETIDHLETLYETGSLKDETTFHQIHDRLELLGKKLNLFLQTIERSAENKKSK